jgi:aspartate carbamoyltransferase catalytic subunit
MIPPGLDQYGVQVYHRPEPALDGAADAVMMLRIQLERQKEKLFLRLAGITLGFSASPLTGWNWPPGTRWSMHPGPIQPRGGDFAGSGRRAALGDPGFRSPNGVAVRMALLYLLIGGGGAQ